MYRVDQIMWDQRASDTFARGDGQISYAQYYEETYGLRVTDVHQPLLLTKAKKRGIKKPSNGNDDESSPVPMDLMLIPEFCIMTGLDDGMRKNRQLMKSIAEVTRSGPEKRLDRAVNHLQLLRQWVLLFNTLSLIVTKNFIIL